MPDRFRQARLRDYWEVSKRLQEEHALGIACRSYQLMQTEPLAFYNDEKKIVITGTDDWKNKAVIKTAVANMDELTRICNTYNFFAPTRGNKCLMCDECIKAFHLSRTRRLVSKPQALPPTTEQARTEQRHEEDQRTLVGDNEEPYSSPLSSISCPGSPDLSPSPEEEDVSAELAELLDDVPEEERFCLCNSISYGQMIECDDTECRLKWFHIDCVGLTMNVLPPEDSVWFCPECSGRFGRHNKPSSKPAAVEADSKALKLCSRARACDWTNY